MFREKMIRTSLGKTTDFRWRGNEISRIEGLSDAVFAFAVTLLVVSLEVPKTRMQSYSTSCGRSQVSN